MVRKGAIFRILTLKISNVESKGPKKKKMIETGSKTKVFQKGSTYQPVKRKRLKLITSQHNFF